MGFKMDLEQIWYLSFYVDALHSRLLNTYLFKTDKNLGLLSEVGESGIAVWEMGLVITMLG